MTSHRIGTRQQWFTASAELLKREKEFTRLGDELARQRRELPWVPVEKQYVLQSADGARTLAELFDGRSQLVVYHFMFGPGYEGGCPSCSSTADSFNGVLAHLKACDVTMICVSGAPIEKLIDYRERMGWSFNWASSRESDYHCYSSYARGTEFLMGYYASTRPVSEGPRRRRSTHELAAPPRRIRERMNRGHVRTVAPLRASATSGRCRTFSPSAHGGRWPATTAK